MSSQLTSRAPLHLGDQLEEAITQLAGPTSIRPAGLGATMEILQDTTPFHLGGINLLPGMAEGKAAGRLLPHQLRK